MGREGRGRRVRWREGFGFLIIDKSDYPHCGTSRNHVNGSGCEADLAAGRVSASLVQCPRYISLTASPSFSSRWPTIPSTTTSSFSYLLPVIVCSNRAPLFASRHKCENGNPAGSPSPFSSHHPLLFSNC